MRNRNAFQRPYRLHVYCRPHPSCSLVATFRRRLRCAAYSGTREFNAIRMFTVALNTSNYWIGGHTLTPNINWRWSADYTAFAYSAWLSGQPDGDGACAHMWLQATPSGGWNDVNCLSTSVWNRPLYFICEKCGGASC